MPRLRDAQRASPWFKGAYLLFVSFMVPVYVAKHGAANLLWGSDIALIVLLFAVLFENRLLAGVIACCVLIAEFVWIFDFLGRLLLGPDALPGPGTAYMWDVSQALWVRLISLFHVVLPVVIFWCLCRFGYDRRAFVTGTLFSWLVLPLSYLAGPEKNINWTYGFGAEPQSWLPQPVYLGVVMLLFPLCIFLPTHLLLRRLFPAQGRVG